MNIHHLELFYYVGAHGGIAGAVRNIPYGIQQPAVSGQIAKLEESLGVKLFQRRPFALSREGEELFEFIRPFFENLRAVEDRIRGNAAPQLRIAAPSVVLHDYMPELLRRVRATFPKFRLQLHEAARAEADRLLRAREVDIAITLLDKKPAGMLRSRPLLQLPLVLLVSKKSAVKDAAQLWARDKIEETLITFPAADAVHVQFQNGLRSRGVEWFPGIEVNSARLIECYVANGYGIGLAVAVPGFAPPAGVRAIPLHDFPPIVVGVAWAGALTPLAQVFLAEIECEAATLNA